MEGEELGHELREGPRLNVRPGRHVLTRPRVNHGNIGPVGYLKKKITLLICIAPNLCINLCICFYQHRLKEMYQVQLY